VTDLIEGEVIDADLVPYTPSPPPTTLFGTDDPAAVVRAAQYAAQPLAAVVRDQHLSVKIGQGEHVKVEGWTLLGSMLGVFPVIVWTHKLENGWEARVEARTRGGEVVGAAESMCDRNEARWKDADEYAIRSMAQTRATSKALRAPLGFVMKLAGYDPTPAEEMPRKPRKRAGQAKVLPGESFEDIFEDAPEPVAPGETKATVQQKKKLDVLVGQLRSADRLHTEHLYQAVATLRTGGLSGVVDVGPGVVPDSDVDGQFHWGPLRDSLNKDEASNLIDRLGRLQDNTETGE
jgi:hypothetical protein